MVDGERSLSEFFSLVEMSKQQRISVAVPQKVLLAILRGALSRVKLQLGALAEISRHVRLPRLT